MAQYDEAWECDCGELIHSDEELEAHENVCLAIWS